MLEVERQRHVCRRLLDQARAQREVADDWAIAYTRYVGGVPMAAPDNLVAFDSKLTNRCLPSAR